MIFNIENDIWFDSEKMYIIKGVDNYKSYTSNQEKYPDADAKENIANYFPIITFLSTTRCNLKCTYCYASQGTYNNISQSNTFTFENYVKAYECVLNEFGGIKGICFFGGEPLINFIEIKKFVEYLFDKHDGENVPSISIGSNGTIMNQEINEFLIKYNISFGTSLDGPKEYNDICRFGCGIHSVYDEVVSTINKLGESGVYTSLQFTFNRLHLENYKKGDVVKWINEFQNLPIAFYQIIAATTDLPDNNVDLSNEKIANNYMTMCEDLAEHSLNALKTGETSIMPSIFAFIIFSISKRRKATHCGAGKNITISPNMRVYPCHVIASDVSNSVECSSGFRSAMMKNYMFKKILNMNRQTNEKCKDCIAKNVCCVFCKGMTSINSDIPPEERCLMMKIFLRKTIVFLATEYPYHKDKIINSVKTIIKNHGALNAEI